MTKSRRILGRLVKLARLARRKAWRRGLRQGVAATVEHAQSLAGLEVRTVIDVGANKGQFALFSRGMWPEARIVALEPLAGPAQRFRRLFADDANVTLIEAALGPKSGTAEIHISKREDSSSLLPIGVGQSNRFPGTEEIAQSTVKTARLRELVDPSELPTPILLKLDVQGFELAALQGTTELLHSISYVYCECSFVELYEGQALAADVAAFLTDHNFKEAGRYNEIRDRDGSAIQADILFKRT